MVELLLGSVVVLKKRPWWVEDRDELFIQIVLLALEALVSLGIALISLLILPIFIGWGTMVEGRVAWFMVTWFVSAFLICFGLFVRAHWKSLN